MICILGYGHLGYVVWNRKRFEVTHVRDQYKKPTLMIKTARLIV